MKMALMENAFRINMAFLSQDNNVRNIRLADDFSSKLVFKRQEDAGFNVQDSKSKISTFYLGF